MEERPCLYTVVRYVPDPIRNEPRNIGVILQCPELHFIDSVFTTDLRVALSRSAPETDIGMAKAYAQDFSRRFERYSSFPGTGELFVEETPVLQEDFLLRLHERASGKLQFTEPSVCLSANPKEELGYLYETFVAGVEHKRSVRKGSQLRTNLRREFNARRLLDDQLHSEPHLRGFQLDLKVAGGESNVEHEFDFVLENGRTHLVKAVDLSLKQSRARHAEGFEAAFVFADIMHGPERERFNAFSVVSTPEDGLDVDYYVRILSPFSEVFIYNDERRRGEFINRMEDLVRGTKPLF